MKFKLANNSYNDIVKYTNKNMGDYQYFHALRYKELRTIRLTI